MTENAEDAFGWPYAKLSEIRAGDFVQADDGFPCIPAGERLMVRQNKYLELYVHCFGARGVPGTICFDDSEGIELCRHLLSGQTDDGEHLIGLYPVSMQQKTQIRGRS